MCFEVILYWKAINTEYTNKGGADMKLFKKRKQDYVTKEMMHKYIDDSIKVVIDSEKEKMLADPTPETVEYFYKLKTAIEKKETEESSNARKMKTILNIGLFVIALLFVVLAILGLLEICKGKWDYILVLIFAGLCILLIYIISLYVKDATKTGVYNIFMTILAVSSLLLTVMKD